MLFSSYNVFFTLSKAETISWAIFFVYLPTGFPQDIFFLRHHFCQMRKVCAKLKKIEPVGAILKMKV